VLRASKAQMGRRSKQEEYSPQSIVRMLEICASCPVRRDCLISALESRFETYGVWGATTLLERRRAFSARRKDAPDLYGDRANTEDITRMQIRTRRAREVAEEFEQDLPARLRRWRRKANTYERKMRGPCPDCGEKLLASSNRAV
jgi:hypothetical protein